MCVNISSFCMPTLINEFVFNLSIICFLFKKEHGNKEIMPTIPYKNMKKKTTMYEN